MDGRGSAQLREKMPIYLSRLGIRVDAMFVTGDFRFARDQQDTDEVADTSVVFLRRIAKSVGVDNARNIHIVPGNHDLGRYESDDDKKRLSSIRDKYSPERGQFVPEDVDFLMRRFSFFRRVCSKLYPDGSVWADNFQPMHKYLCNDGYSILYMNTAVTSNDNDERGKLVIGNNDLFFVLESVKAENPGCPIVVLAHHPMECFSKQEREAVISLLHDYPVPLYLCGDSHEIWPQKINETMHITMGSLKVETSVPPTFAIGELRSDGYVTVNAHFWCSRMNDWGPYTQFNQRIEAILPQPSPIADTMKMDDSTSPSLSFAAKKRMETVSPGFISSLSKEMGKGIHPVLSYAAITRVFGRDSVVSDVYQKLKGAAGLCAVEVHGPPGIGKSSICREVMKRFESVCSTDVDLTQRFTKVDALSAILNAFGAEQTEDLDVQIESLFTKYRGHTVYFDNMEDPLQDNEFKKWFTNFLVSSSRWNILYSSREQIHNSKIHSIRVRPLDMPDAKNMFQSLWGDLSHRDEQKLEELLQVLDYLPLAIKLTATQRNKYPTISALLDAWKNNVKHEDMTYDDDDGAHRSLSTAAKMSFEAVAKNREALVLWGIRSFFPSTLSRSLFDIMFADNPKVYEKAKDIMLKNGLIESLALIEGEGYGYFMLSPLKDMAFTFDESNRQTSIALLRKAFETVFAAGDQFNCPNRSYWHSLSLESLLPALYFLKKLLPDVAENRQLISLMQKYYKFSAQVSLELLNSIAEQQVDEELLAFLYYHMANQEFCLGKHNAAQQHYTLAEELYRAKNNNLGLANVLRGMGNLERIQWNIEAAQLHYTQAEKLYRAEKARLGLANVLYRMGILKHMQEQNVEAMQYFIQAQELFLVENDNLGQANVLKCLGDLECGQGKIKAAQQYYAQAEEQYRNEKANRGLANTLLSIGDLASNQGQIEIPRGYYAQAEEIYRIERDNLGLANVIQSIGDLEYRLENFSHAIDCYENALTLYESERDPMGKGYVIGKLCLAQARAGNEYEVLRLFKVIDDLFEQVPESLRPIVTNYIKQARHLLYDIDFDKEPKYLNEDNYIFEEQTKNPKKVIPTTALHVKNSTELFTDTIQQAVKVFVSYSWDTEEHRAHVLEFANFLRAEGIDAELDQYHSDNPDPWPRWCENQIRESRFVLMVCTPIYKERIENPETNPKEGLGVCWEADYIYNDLYISKGRNEKYLPVLLDENDPQLSIPGRLTGFSRYRIQCPYSTSDGFQQMLDRLNGINRTPKPPLGIPSNSDDTIEPPPMSSDSKTDEHHTTHIPIFRDLQRKTDGKPEVSTFRRLRFANRTVEYIRLEEVWQVFEGFYSSSDVFSWWLIAGAAGTGKSRTALEFYEFLKREKNWNAGFVSLEDTPIQTWHTWCPKRDTLLIIDYAAREFSDYSRNVINIFSQRAEDRELGDKRIRILLLEREYQDRAISGEPGNKHIHNWLQERECQDRSEIRQPLEWYRQLDKTTCYKPPFDLNTISDEGLYTIAAQTAKDIWVSPEPLLARSDFLDKLEKLDKKKRPLFAMLLAGYLAKVDPKAEIHPNDVFDFAIEQEFERFLIPMGVEKEPDLLHSLLLSTCTGCKLGALSLPRNHRLWNSGLGSLREENGNDFFIFHPIEPDLLGERFILNRGGGGSPKRVNKKQLQKLLQICWQDAPMEIGNFFKRCTQDFASSDSKNIADLFLSAIPTIKENVQSHKAGRFALVNLAAFLKPADGEMVYQATAELGDTLEIAVARAYAALGLMIGWDLPEARRVFETMAELGDAPDIAFVRSEAALQLIESYIKAENFSEARNVFEAMAIFCKTPRTILMQYKAAFDLIYGYLESEYLTEAQTVFESMSEFDETKGFATMRAYAAYCLVAYYAKVGNLHEAQKLFDSTTEFEESPAFAVTQAGVVVDLIRGYVKIGNLTEAQRIFDSMTKFGETHEIVLMRANAAVNLINGYGEAETVNLLEAQRVFDSITDFDNASEIAVVRAKAAVNLIGCYVKAENLSEARKLFNSMATFGETPEIVYVRAKAFFNLITDYTEIGNLSEAQKLFDSMSELGEAPNISLERANAAFNLINGYNTVGNLHEARKVFDFMTKISMTPDIAFRRACAAFNLIGNYLKDKNFSEARKVFNSMTEFGDTPEIALMCTNATHNLIAGYAKVGNLVEAQKLFNSMTEFGDTPEIAIMRVKAAANLILGYVNSDNFPEAQRVFDSVSELGNTPEIAIEYVNAALNLIYSYAEAGKLLEAQKVFEAITKFDNTSETALVRANAAFNLITNYVKAENFPEARNLFDSMSELDDTPEIAIVCANAAFNLILGYVISMNFSDARKVFDCIVEFDCIPDVALKYANMAVHLIDCYVKDKDLTEAQKLFDFMSKIGDTPEIAIERAKAALILIHCCNLSEARKVFDSMTEFGDTPEITFMCTDVAFILICFYSYPGIDNFSEARNVFDTIVGFNSTPEIAFEQADAAFNLIIDHLKAENISDARKLFDSLVGQDLRNESISSAVGNASNGQGLLPSLGIAGLIKRPPREQSGKIDEL
jgi:pentatricopeptide repeat protein